MPPASRITDMHVCPMVTGVVPHERFERLPVERRREWSIGKVDLP